MSNSAKLRAFEVKGDFIRDSSDRELCGVCELMDGARLALEGMIPTGLHYTTSPARTSVTDVLGGLGVTTFAQVL